MFRMVEMQLLPGKKLQDITDSVADVVQKLNFRSGLCNVYSKHTTLGVRIFEAEPLLLVDTLNTLERFAPKDGVYAHDNIDCRDVPPDEPINGHSHIKSLLVNTSETIPVLNNVLQLGRWQRLLAFELDTPKDRRIIVSCMGEFTA